ncbi:hypothetical protein [Congregibacter sp.]|uniref:hypothetical protein n=1 Tax=Congregibacter sp. TaxID=2744308 RepID=UPI003F6AB995
MNATLPAQASFYSAAVAALDLDVVIYEPVSDARDFRILAMNPAALEISQVDACREQLGYSHSERDNDIEAWVADPSRLALASLTPFGYFELSPATHD